MNCFDSCGRGARRRTDEFFFSRSAGEMRSGLRCAEQSLDELYDGFRDMQIGRCIERTERDIRSIRRGHSHDCCKPCCKPCPPPPPSPPPCKPCCKPCYDKCDGDGFIPPFIPEPPIPGEPFNPGGGLEELTCDETGLCCNQFGVCFREMEVF